MTLFDDCRRLFHSDDFYKILGITKSASESEVKRAYHKLSLRVHPDRVDENKDEATKQFQTLGKIYSILSDKEKRALYDETGEVDEENDIPMDRDWLEYWRLLYAKISVKDIEEFEKQYRGSDEETNDLKSAYVDYEGDMDMILDSVLCCTHEDEDRFREILDPLIKKGELPKFKKYTENKAAKQKERKRKANKEAKEAAEMKQELGLGDTDDALKQMIQKRQESREKELDGFFDQLAAKYAAPSGKKKGKKGK